MGCWSMIKNYWTTEDICVLMCTRILQKNKLISHACSYELDALQDIGWCIWILKIAHAGVVNVSNKINRKRNKWQGYCCLFKEMHKLKKYTTEITKVSSKKNTNEHLKLLRFMWITWLPDQWIILIQDYWNTEIR